MLASLYMLSSSSDEFSFECDGKELSASHWVSYFHQASLGTHISYQFISNLSRRHKSQCLSDKEVRDGSWRGIFNLSVGGLTPVASVLLMIFYVFSISYLEVRVASLI